MPCDCSSRTSSKVSMPVSFAVLAVAALDAHPHPGDAQADELVDGVGAQHVGRAEHVERPRLAVLLHQFQQPQGPLAVEEEVFVHHEERADVHVGVRAGT